MSERFVADAGGFSGGLTAGSLIAGYRLESRIGAGGMAIVFRARDERLGRVVALKMLSPELDADDGFRQRFIRECRVATSIDDPHIIPIHDAGEADGVLFIAMRYVPGGDVRDLLKQNGPLPPSRVAVIISPVASALDAAHAAGLVHRDVKPENMLLDARPGRPVHVYLSDFGLSKRLISSVVGLTRSGLFLGTANYASPEQIQGDELDGRTDQYALACTAFELLTGQVPFQHDDQMAVIWAQVSKEPPALSSRRPGLPAAVDQVLARALAKSPDNRYGSCREFADALRGAFMLPSYDDDAAVRLDGRPPTVVVPPIAGPVSDRTGQASTIGRGHELTASPSTEPPIPLIPAKRQRGTARIRVAGSTGLSVLLLSLSLSSFGFTNVSNSINPARLGALIGLAAAIFGMIISIIEWRRKTRLEALVHALNTTGLVLVVGGVILYGVTSQELPIWLGYAAFLPLAAGNAICSIVTGVQARKISQANGERKLRRTLSAVAATLAISYILFAILNSQSDSSTPFASKIAVAAAVLFLVAFLISCRALKIVNSERRSLR